MHLHHLALGARNVKLVSDFYATTFGLTELRRHSYADGRVRSIWLELSGAALMIEETSRAREHSTGVDAGCFLIAFSIGSDARQSFERMIASRGIVIEDRSEFTTYFRDPEGNRVAVSCYPMFEGVDSQA